MFDGRHCTEKDLKNLIKETNKINSVLSKNIENSEKNAELQRFLQFLRRFDSNIADNLERQIAYRNEDYSAIKKDIDMAVNELKQNIAVDIFEHQ